MRKPDAVALVALLAAGYARELPRPTVALYAQEIAGEDYEVAQAAIRSVIRSSEFFPSLATLLAAIRREKADRAPSLASLPAGDDGVSLDELPPEQRAAWDAVRATIARLRWAE